ncbi:Sec-independent protein translocase protein TatB [Pontixanthobacter aestiaquae]|uniref:Sec-independent protein translocase protein TatB n=1 Tax=Pontixanthobacter aestiaquae TaxID=1509367 RepID=A0A844ZAS2_9SPHN|nr:Sec-independent protein translocase protein TatB [Pontixanthobacter aestiaquae]MDN3646059.1 Sec-independent protein translocase protein TatB [Pontixanthobacter aestiaquae]MXO82949.1 twin-arginine translocase subunit TatB [Pontixanthobacter aestiaquae]
MFDIGALELLMIVVVAIIVIGPKDMPAALRVAGRWIGKLRRASAQFRSGFDSIVREAEMEDMEKKWKEQNAKIMAETPSGEMGPLPESEADVAMPVEEKPSGKPVDLTMDANAEASINVAPEPPEKAPRDEPMLPLESGEKS